MNEPSGTAALWIGARMVDFTGLKCPLPALMTAKALRDLPVGSLLAIMVSDPLAPLDLRHLCQKDGHTVLDELKNQNGARLLIRSGPRG